MIDFKSIQSLVASDMQKADQVILEQLNSPVALINQIGSYIIHNGGKRLRPLLTLITARALGAPMEQSVVAASFIELIHTATLLHDDVVDMSEQRRGQASANIAFGNASSVLVGDFIYTRAFQMMTSTGSLQILKLMSDAVNVISEGEVQQLMNCHDPDTTEASYMQVIYSKTARLFEVATQVPGVLAGVSATQEEQLKSYGMHLGTAFQLIDDVLDYTADNETLGKNIGDDLSEGKPTLPLIHAIQVAAPEQKAILRQAIESPSESDEIGQIIDILHQTQSLDYAVSVARKEAELAINALDFMHDSDYKKALVDLAHLSVKRSA